jgi:hypothetical protein
MDYFKYFGGDIEHFLFQCKITHSKRIFGKCYTKHKIINKDDIINGFEKYKINKTNADSILYKNMYL